jgi:serine/threonine protein kinase
MDLSPGTRILNLLIGQKIGRGAFGEIYSAIDSMTGSFWAVKTESASARRKTLEFEYQILRQVQPSQHFARLGTLGRCGDFSFFSMEPLGPSLSGLLKKIEPRRFSFSSGVRGAYHILKCIESFHRFGFVHRDIKPGNILTRDNVEFPLCLIDFGLSRVYVNHETGQHLQQRARVGFRGTRAYASRYAHLGQDLSRRDDLISWFYLTFELIIGPLPWRRCTDKSQVLFYKENFEIRPRVETIAPELFEVWKHIAKLGFQDAPNYGYVYHNLMKIIQNNAFEMEAPFDWFEHVRQEKRRMVETLEGVREGRVLQQVEDLSREMELESTGAFDPLLSPHITVPPPFSHESETAACGCC